jgi:PAS domain S-box-containing protein
LQIVLLYVDKPSEFFMSIPISVLFIDDSEVDVWILLNEIRKANYAPVFERVYSARDMERALGEREWGVIICDYQMPGFNAPVALRTLNQSGLDIPFIVVSGAVAEETGIAVMRAGAHDYIMKDNLARLIPAIEREMAEAANRREHRNAEKRVLRLGQILDGSSNEILVFDLEFRLFIQVNRSACENLGFSAEELSHMSLLDIQPELTARQFDLYLDTLLKDDKSEIAFETIHRRKNNTSYPVEVHLHMSRSEKPAIFIAIIRDISERKQAEKALKVTLDKITDLYRISRSVGAMRTVADILMALLNSQYLNISEVVMLLFDKPEEANASAQHKIHTVVRKNMPIINADEYGFPGDKYPASHLISRESTVLVEDVNTDARLSPEARKQLASANVYRMMLFPLQNTAIWYGVLALHFGCSQPWSRDDVRHIEGLVDQVVIAIDNVMLLNSEAKARAEAERANQLKLQLLAMISHELRTPLTSIKGFSTTLLAENVELDTQQQRNFLSIIDEETDKLTDLIEQLLDLSRMQAGTFRIIPKPHSFDQILEASMMHLNMLTKNHRLSMQMESHLPVLNVDIRRIAQVLENLIANSVKYSSPGTEIQLSVKSVGTTVQVDVTDQGFGIPLGELSRIFDAFHQIKPQHNADGAGLGLAICKGLIEAHGGNIWIQETTSSGTTVSFSLPTISTKS